MTMTSCSTSALWITLNCSGAKERRRSIPRISAPMYPLIGTTSNPAFSIDALAEIVRTGLLLLPWKSIRERQDYLGLIHTCPGGGDRYCPALDITLYDRRLRSTCGLDPNNPVVH